MNMWILAAGALSLLFVGVHVIGGGQDVFSPLLTSLGTVELKGYVSVLWHAVTANMLVCSTLFLLHGMVWHGSVLVMPQWIGFLGIAGVALLGLGFNPMSTARQ